MISPDKAGLQGAKGKTEKPSVRQVVGWVALAALVVVVLSVAEPLGRLWLRTLDLYLADGDPQRVALAAVVWCWLLIVPITLAAWATRRLGRYGVAAWLLVVAGVLPLVAFFPSALLGGNSTYPVASSNFDAIQTTAEEALGFGAPAGAVSFIAYMAFASTLFASVFLSDLRPGVTASERPGIVETGGTWRAPLLSWAKIAVVWTVVWGAMAGIMLVVVESYPGRGSWLATNASQLRAGEDGATGGFQVTLLPDVAEVVSCEEAAAAIDVDGGTPDLPGCRSALLVSATGLVDADEGGVPEETGEVVGVVLQTLTAGQVDPLQASLDDAAIVEGAGLPAAPGRTLVTSSTTALAVFVTAEDPGNAPAGEGSAAVPLTRSLAYLVIGTAQELYVAPNPV